MRYGDDYEVAPMLERPGIHVKIYQDAIISHASEEVVLQLMHDEIRQALSDDPDLRVLVREFVRDAIAKMNLQEVVALAVREHLKVDAKDASQDNP